MAFQPFKALRGKRAPINVGGMLVTDTEAKKKIGVEKEALEEERIYHMAGARTPQSSAEQMLRAAIAETGREPCRRDTHYGVLDVA